MIDRHIVNIGYPKCGTSWLWTHLAHVFKTNYDILDKENSILLDQPNIDVYIEHYRHQKTSMNFQTHLFEIDQSLIKQISCIASHVSVILRNPYELAQSWFVHLNYSGSHEQFLWFLFDQKFLHMADIVTRWQQNSDKQLGIFFFDHLQQDPQGFLENYLSFCNSKLALDQTVDYSLPTNQTKDKIQFDFSYEYRQKINDQIARLEQVAGKNLSHWRRP